MVGFLFEVGLLLVFLWLAFGLPLVCYWFAFFAIGLPLVCSLLAFLWVRLGLPLVLHLG